MKLGIRRIMKCALRLLHIACAIHAGAEYFLTTDDGILKKAKPIQRIRVADPIGFIKEALK